MTATLAAQIAAVRAQLITADSFVEASARAAAAHGTGLLRLATAERNALAAAVDTLTQLQTLNSLGAASPAQQVAE